MGSSERYGHPRRLWNLLREDIQQHVLRDPSGKWRIPADLQLQSDDLSGARIPEPHFHTTGRNASGPIFRRAHASNHAIHPAGKYRDDPRPVAELVESE